MDKSLSAEDEAGASVESAEKGVEVHIGNVPSTSFEAGHVSLFVLFIALSLM